MDLMYIQKSINICWTEEGSPFAFLINDLKYTFRECNFTIMLFAI